MCIEYDRTPVETDTYLLFAFTSVECFFRLWRRNRSTIDRGVGVVVGVMAISLALLFRWADIISYFLSHKFHIIDPSTIFSLSCCGRCCYCFFIIFFVIFFLSLLVCSLIVVCFAIKNYIPVPHNGTITKTLVRTTAFSKYYLCKYRFFKTLVHTP